MMGQVAALAKTYAGRLSALPRKALLASPPAVRRALGPGFFEGITPEFLWLETTAACSNRCKFCDIGNQTPSARALTPAEVESTLRDPLFRRLRFVVVSGGEPTLRPDLEAVLASVHRAAPAARIVLSTSAAQPERLLRAVRTALEQGSRLEVGVSVDGIGARHDDLRGVPGLFAKVDGALRELVALRRAWGSRLRICVSMVICDDTVDQVDAVRRYAAELGAVFNPQWYNQAAYYGNLGRDRLSATAVLSDIAKKLEPSPLNDFAMRWLRGRAPKARCTMTFNACVLKSSGDMVPCFVMWNSVFGNVRQATPTQIWNSARARWAREQVMACDGCLNSCGVVWSNDVDYLARSRFYLRHPRVLMKKLREQWAERRWLARPPEASARFGVRQRQSGAEAGSMRPGFVA